MAEDDAKYNTQLPSSMDEYALCGIEVLEHGTHIPKKLLKACAGILLLKAEEAGLVVSAQGGNGVALAHKDGKWSNPVCVNIISMGAGVVFGYANKCIIMLLNHFAMDRMLEGNGSISIGVDTGFAVGKTGRAASADIELSNRGGLGSSLVYTYSKGVMVSLQAVLGARANPPWKPNKEFYGTTNYADILNGSVDLPKGSKVPSLLEKLTELENGPEADANQE